MNKISLPAFGRTFLVTVALFASTFALEAMAKTEKAECAETLLASQAEANSEVAKAMKVLDHYYANGLSIFADTQPAPVIQAKRTDAEVVLLLAEVMEATLEQTASEYVVSTLSLSGFCGKYGKIEDHQRLRAATSMMNAMPWISRDKVLEIQKQMKGILPKAEVAKPGAC